MTWDEAKARYIRGDKVAAIARDIGTSRNTIYRHIRDEGWDAEREAAERDKSDSFNTSLQLFQDKAVNDDAEIFAITGILLKKIRESAELIQADDTKIYRDLTIALRDIKELRNIRTEQDIREQEARIEKLRAEIAEKQSGDTVTRIEVVGLPEEYKQ